MIATALSSSRLLPSLSRDSPRLRERGLGRLQLLRHALAGGVDPRVVGVDGEAVDEDDAVDAAVLVARPERLPLLVREVVPVEVEQGRVWTILTCLPQKKKI